jgi:hypothetical protein
MASAIAMVARSCASAPRVTSSLRAAQATGGRAYSLLNALAGGTPEPQTHRERRLLRCVAVVRLHHAVGCPPPPTPSPPSPPVRAPLLWCAQVPPRARVRRRVGCGALPRLRAVVHAVQRAGAQGALAAQGGRGAGGPTESDIWRTCLLAPLPQPWGMEAELVVGFHLFAERYTSIVTLEPGKRVEVRHAGCRTPLSPRPLRLLPLHARAAQAVARNTQLFHFLRNEWLFEDGPTNPQSASAASSAISASGASSDAVANVPAAADLGTCWVVFRVEFAFRSALYARASGLFFDEVVTKMVSAFERRCAEQLPAYLQAKSAAAAAAMPARRVLTQSSLSPSPLLPAIAAPTPPSALAWPVGRGTAVPASVPAVRAPPASSAASRAGDGAISHLPAAAPVASAGKGAIQPTASAHGAHSIPGAQAAQAVSARVDVPARAAVGEVLRPVVQRHTFSLW